MPSKIERLGTSQFTDRAPLHAVGALGLLALALIIAPFLSRQLVQTSLLVEPEATAQIDPIRPSSSPIGALRIDATARLPDNSWSIFEVQVLDTEGNLLASAIKQAWRESGTWQEDGESGTWSERDLMGSFDLRQTTLNGPIVVAISVLEQGTVGGQPLTEPTTFQVTVRDGMIDTRFLWSGALGALILALMAAIAVKKSGQIMINRSINDSDVMGRAILGGTGKMVRVIIDVLSDETSPPTLNAELVIKDRHGEVIYQRRIPIRLGFRKENGRVDSARGSCTLDLVLEPEGSYGFLVEIVPDAPVDRTVMVVKQGVRTLVPTPILRIQSD